VSTIVVFLAYAALLTSRPGTLCLWGKRALKGQKRSQIIACHSLEVSAEHTNTLIGEFNQGVIYKGMGGVRKTNMA